MAALSQLVSDLGAEARRRWHYIAIIFASVGGMAAVALAAGVVQ